MQGKNPALAALKIFTSSDKGAQERFGVRLHLQKGAPFIGCENIMAPVDGFRTDDQLPHAVDRAAFLVYHQTWVGKSSGIEQIGRESVVEAFFWIAVDVGIAKQALVHPRIPPPI